MKRMARPPRTHGLESAAPKTPPVSAAINPRGVKSAAIPNTNAVESIADCTRDSAWRAPKTLTVIAIIG